MSDVDAELRKLEKDFKLDEIKITKKEKLMQATEQAKEETVKKKAKKKWKDMLRTKPPRGQQDVPVDEELAKTFVALPFDYWASTRHDCWKLTPDEESRLGRAFVKAFGPLIPWIIRRYFPIITFCVLFLKMIEEKRKLEARMILEGKLDEFSPAMRKKIVNELEKPKKRGRFYDK